MNYLLDTHTFLWFINDDEALSSKAKATIEDVESEIYLSIASIWKMAIKVSLGKLAMPLSFIDFLMQEIHENEIVLLGIKTEHIKGILNMPFHHRDPFDRLIIAQAMYENLTIIGNDVAFNHYGVKMWW
ncbi:MAG: type II toxin-antitoxin system VapC family toxin [Anaerolineae bacterium]|jgi:PIN domain nuclease of toxin-antitoxin system|nr:type II toxin-antitoxin system VapC family toxin [Anaerolineae bacterium]